MLRDQTKSRYLDLLQADAALHELAHYMIRCGSTVEATAIAMLPLTATFYEALSDLSWNGYLIESGGGDAIAKAADNCAARI